MSRPAKRVPRVRGAIVARAPFEDACAPGGPPVDPPGNGAEDSIRSRASGDAPTGTDASADAPRGGAALLPVPDEIPIGATAEFPVEVRMASLGRLLDSDWHFDESLDLSRELRMVAVRISSTCWRLREVLPLTPFGLAAPRLGLGDVVELAPARSGPPRLVRRVEVGRRWEYRVGDVPEDALERPDVVRVLRELHGAGGSWVIVGEALVVHFPRLPFETMPSPAASERMPALRRLLRA